MKVLLVYLATSVVLFGIGERLPKDPNEYAAWEARLLKRVEEQESLPPDESIPQLGRWLRQLSRPQWIERQGSPVFSAAQDALLSIPDHAEWFGVRIRSMADANLTGNVSPYMTEGRRRYWDFETLTQLPSPETVKVLGELLFDERTIKHDMPDDSPWVPNCYYAVRALHYLGLNNPPVTSEHPEARKDLRAWQLWYEQVRAGSRTFAFKGDDNEYSLTGPVRRSLPTKPLRSNPDTPETNPVDPVASTSISGWPLLIALGVLVAGVFAFVQSRLRRSA